MKYESQVTFPFETQTSPRSSMQRAATVRSVVPLDLPRDRPGETANRDVDLVLDADFFLRAAFCCIVVFMVLNLLAAYALVSEADVPMLATRAFLLDQEANLPTLFAFGLLVFNSILLALIGARALLAQQRFRFHWALLAALFFLLAFDEAASLHERLNEPVRAALGTSGGFYFAWVIPVGGIAALLAFSYLQFLHALPAPLGRLFVLSGALFVAGALGVEMLGAAYYEANGKLTMTYQIIATAEETLEMLGLAVFAYTLMRFLARLKGKVCLGFRPGRDEMAQPR